MADWFEGYMNLDLNVDPVPPTTPAIRLETERERETGTETSLGEPDRLEPPLVMRIRQAVRLSTRQRWRWRPLWLPVDARTMKLAVYSDASGGTSQVGEGSAASEERISDVLKTCEHNVALLESGLVKEKESVEKTSTEAGSFFDCNICLDLAKEPIVTCCGHLFCWSCIYRWLHIHCDGKECPVCKGQVTPKNVTPIYGRGNHIDEPEEDLDIKIQARPSGKRVEILRRRTASSFPMQEMIRRLGAQIELTRDLLQLQSAEGGSEPSTVSTRASLMNRIMTTRALQRDQAASVSPPLTYRRHSLRSGSDVHSTLRSQEMQPSLVDDRDSFSSIAGVIHGERPTVDTSVEIDSQFTHSTSSSRRRLDTSRGSDMNSRNSRALRRRRLN